MSWAEVHDEAEQLEHAVSERLIERIDECLGRPSVDPHGDPIPTAEGRIAHPDYPDLLSSPPGAIVEVQRVLDQSPGFLRFVEEHGLVPGRTVTVERRDDDADSVVLRTADGRSLTLGTRAASKILVSISST